MNTKGKIDFTKTDNIQFIEEVAREISKEDKDWQWEVRKIKQHSLLLWWELLEGSGQEGLKLNWKKGRLWKRTITTKPSSAAKHICTWMTYRHRRSCQCQDIQQSRRTTKSESL